MKKLMLVATALLAAGCGKSDPKVEVTPELEAEQRRDDKNVRDAESAMQKQQKPARTQEQEVDAAEGALQRKNNRK